MITFMINFTSMVYNGHVGTKNPLFKNQMIYFNVYVAATSI